MSSKKSQKPEITLAEKQKQQLQQLKKTDPSHIKQQIHSLRTQLQDIVSKKQSLENQIKVNMAKNFVSTSVIQQNLGKEEEQIVEIQNLYHSELQKNEIQLRMLKKMQEKQIAAAEQKNRKEQQKKKQQLTILTEKLTYLQSYKTRRPKYLQSIAQLTTRLQEMQVRHEKDIQKIKNTHEKQRTHNEKQTQSEMQKIKQLQVNKLQQKMTKQQFIKKQNEVMQKDITLCQQQITILTKQCQQLKKDIELQKNGVGDNVLGNQANQTYERSLRIIKLQGKLQKLKIYLNQQTTKLQKQYNDIDVDYKKQQEEVQDKIGKVDGWLRIKERDLKKVKACSQMVLNQRSNLQAYLLEVFHQHPEINYKQQQNINKILRFLFTKINSKKQPISYKNFLGQSRSISESSFRA